METEPSEAHVPHVCLPANVQDDLINSGKISQEPSQPETSTDLVHPKKTWQDRVQPLGVPHFHELEDIDFSQPAPGTFRFPNSESENGTRTPYKQLHERPDILPPKDEPFFSQIQGFCQRWAVWAATIKQDDRRKEVLDWVMTKMADAWKFGILHGHYNFGPLEAAEKERLLKENRTPKRPIDMRKKAAPFVCEAGYNKDYNILNAELENAGVTMDMINNRIEEGKLDRGDELLQIMISRLQRDLELTDWRQNSRFAFRASVHSRNLFMYALWEVQRCRKLIAMLERKLKGNAGVSQQKAWRSRIETNRTRSMQHMALAIELDLKDPIDNIQATPVEDDTPISSEVKPDEVQSISKSRSKRRSKGVASSELAETNDAGLSTDTRQNESTMEEQAMKHSDVIDSSSNNARTPSDNAIESTSAELPELPELPPGFSFDMELDCNPGKRRSSDGDDDESQQKKQKTDNTTFSLHGGYPDSSPVGRHDNQPLRSMDPRHIARAQLVSNNENRQAYHGAESSTSQAPPDTGRDSVDEEVKRHYLVQVWQPKMDLLLSERGLPYLTEKLAKWSDVRNILMQLKINAAQRNEYLREYKRGLAAQELSSKGSSAPTQSEQAQQTKLTLKIPYQPDLSEQYSDRIVNETRGFYFRCLPTASAEQRARLDDLVNDYVTGIIARRVRRFGMYIVMHDPEHAQRMPIAHGIWNHKDKSQVKGMEWFYAGEDVPAQLDIDAWHIHDFDQPTPKTPKRTAATSANNTTITKKKTKRGNQTGRASQAKSKRGAERSGQASSPYEYYDEAMTFDDPEDDDYDPKQW